jgi:hypothetical protein
MVTGHLEISLDRSKKAAILSLTLYPGGFGIAPHVTLEELEALAAYCTTEAARWRADTSIGIPIDLDHSAVASVPVAHHPKPRRRK